MRAKIEAEKGSEGTWDLKQVRGGLDRSRVHRAVPAARECAPSIPRCSTRTPSALAKLSAAGLLAPGDAEILLPAARLYQSADPGLRLCLDGPFVPEEAPRGLKELLARAAEMPDFASLEAS